MKEVTEIIPSLRNSIDHLNHSMSVLDVKLDNIEARMVDNELRIAALENNFDQHMQSHVEPVEEEFRTDNTVVCSGLVGSPREDIHQMAQVLVNDGLGMVDIPIVRAIRMRSHNEKPGLVKIEFRNKDEKIRALRLRRNLADNGFRKVYLRAAATHTDRAMQRNFTTLLKLIPNGDKYRIANNGLLVSRDEPRTMGTWSRGPPITHATPDNGH